MIGNPFICEGRTNFRCFENWETIGFTALTGWVNVYRSPHRTDTRDGYTAEVEKTP